MLDKISKVAGEFGSVIVSGIVEAWILVTLGMLTLLGFIGKRMLNRWDNIIKTHVTDVEIDAQFKQVYKDMSKCQDDLKGQQDKILNNVGEVHSRIDDIYKVIATGAAPRKHRKK